MPVRVDVVAPNFALAVSSAPAAALSNRLKSQSKCQAWVASWTSVGGESAVTVSELGLAVVVAVPRK